MFPPFQLRDVVAALVVCGLATAAVVPTTAKLRESARQSQCGDRLRAIGLAMRQYHDAQGALPPAAVWEPATLNSLMLYEVKRFDRIIHENWALLLLPYLGRSDVAAKFDRNRPIMSAQNTEARMTRAAEFLCPTDRFNEPDNPYGFQPWDDQPPLAEFARGNYAMNGGSHSIKYPPQSTTEPRGELFHITLDHERRHFEAVGTGVAGINHSFRLTDFANGQSTLVAVDEVRAGVHSLDMRGVWALGHIGGSITCAHGVVGDACGPNNQWDRSDDIFDCGRLHKVLGSGRLEMLGMPCCWYIDLSEEATARSQHPGGVHVLFVDGAARFVADDVDRGLWHALHSRQTPKDIFGELPLPLGAAETPPDAAKPPMPAVNAKARETLTNSLEMAFVALPAGVFTMGVPDIGNDAAPPPECPAHEVEINRAFWIGAHEVTQKQFQSVMGTNPSHHGAEDSGAEVRDDFPVENVTWYDAQEFCRRLGELAEERAAHRRYRLPTEAEWEYACRSGKSGPYRWLSRRSAEDGSGEAAGIEPALPLAKVGSYPANRFGLHDMRGNVWEWCGDWFDRGYYRRSPRRDPQGPGKGYLKVVRGGDWIFVGQTCRINCSVMSPWQRSPFVGFRVVCEPAP